MTPIAYELALICARNWASVTIAVSVVTQVVAVWLLVHVYLLSVDKHGMNTMV